MTASAPNMSNRNNITSLPWAINGYQPFKISTPLVNVLQTTLDIDRLVTLFANRLNDLLAFDSIAYHEPQRGINIEMGERALHSVNYNLHLENSPQGTLYLTRRSPFVEAELVKIEESICALLYPLRNALLYKDAIKAAQQDPLTHIGNRSALNEHAKREINLAHRHNQPLSVAVFDIDFFKQINDKHGHFAGDVVLKAIANTLNQCGRDSDLAFRYGGEEFVMILSGTDSEGAEKFAERCRECIEGLTIHCGGKDIQVTISAGVASLTEDENFEALFNRADLALYQAKANGRNQVSSPMLVS
jgi:diguanylate cyclase (GGDEF)-like protein